MCAPRILAAYLQMKPCSVPVVCDPERLAYQAMGLGKISFWRLFRPGVLFKFMVQILQGHKIRRIREGEDAMQAGGDYLLRPDRTLVWGYQGLDPTDRPKTRKLLQIVRTRLVDASPVNS